MSCEHEPTGLTTRSMLCYLNFGFVVEACCVISLGFLVVEVARMRASTATNYDVHSPQCEMLGRPPYNYKESTIIVAIKSGH